MKAIILAAGQNHELDAIVGEKPKCMLQIGNSTILDRQISILNSCGIDDKDIIIVVGYKYENIKVSKDIEIIINNQYSTTHNSYSLFLALDRVDDSAIILDSDLIFEKKLIENVMTQRGNLLVATDHKGLYGETGIKVNSLGKPYDIGKHIDSDVSFRGILRIEKNIVEEFKTELSESYKMWYSVPLSKMLEKYKFCIYNADSDILEINNYADYLQVKRVCGNENNLIMVTGASGFLGNKIYYMLKRSHNVIGTKSTSDDENFYKVDLCNYYELEAFVQVHNPGVIIHTAAMPDPDKCEKNKYIARQINVDAVRNIVSVCRTYKIKLIYISTDYVFDGNNKKIYGKYDEKKPVNYYGQTKLDAENIVSQYKNSLIVRTPILYGYNSDSDKVTFPLKVIEMLKKGEMIEVDDQQLRYPVLIDEVANAIIKAIDQEGIIHITSEKKVTKYEWAKIIAKEFGYDEGMVVAKNGSLNNRPMHIKLKTDESDYIVSDVEIGTRILKCQMMCVLKLIYKNQPYNTIYNKNIATYRMKLGRKMANIIPKAVVDELDYVVPVPSSGMYYAMGMAEKIKKPYLQALVKPDVSKRSFQISDFLAREHFIRKKIYPIPELIKEKTILLVDEAIFTGITLAVVCDMVRACGAKKIYICIPTPESRFGCNNYVQPKRKLALGANDNIDVLKEYFQVDDIFFQDYDVFAESVSDIQNVCCECFNGD